METGIKTNFLLFEILISFHGAGEHNKAGVSISGMIIYKVAKAVGKNLRFIFGLSSILFTFVIINFAFPLEITLL